MRYASHRNARKSPQFGASWKPTRYSGSRATPELVQRGRRLYQERADKDWPLTDCISFIVMQDEGVRDALTADRHFDQAGFKALFAQP